MDFTNYNRILFEKFLPIEGEEGGVWGVAALICSAAGTLLRAAGAERLLLAGCRAPAPSSSSSDSPDEAAEAELSAEIKKHKKKSGKCV